MAIAETETEPKAGRYVEFETTGEEYWAVDRFDLLAEDFSLETGDLADWHAAMAGQGLAWEICRRIYQVGSIADPDEDVLRTWSRAEIAKKFGIPLKQVDHELANAVEHWRLKHAREEVSRQAAALADDDEIERLTSFSNSGGIEKETVDRLLEAFNFSDVKDEGLRAQVAKRILSLKEYLSGPHTRTSAREIIRMEVTMHGLEKILVSYQNQIERLVEEDPERRTRGAEIDALSKKAQELDGKIRDVGESHAKKQKAIGADDIDMTTRKRIFVETVAYIQEKCREYESDPENVLADGVFRPREIDWLLEPCGERTPQYRPDISVRLAEALTPKNLWDPDYMPTPISQRVCQELRRMVEHLREVPEDAPALPEVDEDDDDAEGGTFEGNSDVPLIEPGVEQEVVMSGPVFERRKAGPAMGVF